MSELLPCPFCGLDRVKLLVDQEEWDAARVACKAHRCGALGPWVELSDHPTLEEAKSEAVRLWNSRPHSEALSTRPATTEDAAVSCRHEPYEGSCIHCDIPFRFGQPYHGEPAIAAMHDRERELREALNAFVTWSDRAGIEAEDAGVDYLNEEGWGDLDRIARQARAALSQSGEIQNA